MTILYPVKDNLYVNLTNRCPCACTFCLRNQGAGVYGSDSLWLEREPTVAEVLTEFVKYDLAQYREIVFCGYGEPTERLEDLLTIARALKAQKPDIRIRVNTNGLSDLINKRSTATEFAGVVDTLSISLNTDDPAEYVKLCNPVFGDAAYPALLTFAKEAAQVVPQVVFTIVGAPITSPAQQARCQVLAAACGVTLRIRPYEG